jgi:hypothetical protein
VNAGARSRRAQPPRLKLRAFAARAAVAAAVAAVAVAALSIAFLSAGPGGAAAATTTADSVPPPAADPASAEDIRDIRGPKAYLPPWLIPAIAGAVLLIALATYAAWRWVRRRRPARTLQPYEIALQRLEELRPLMHPASVREFSIAISDVVRRYIEEAFSVIATQRTTEEFLHDLLASAHPALAPHRQLLAEFLNRCDLAKFAGMSFSQQDLESLHQSARSFVLSTSKPLVTHDPLPAT